MNRLARLVSPVSSRAPTTQPTDRRRFYSLTEASIQIVPLLAHMGALMPVHSCVEALSIRAQLLEEGRERMWKAFMAELRSIHMGAPMPRRSVFAELQAKFEPPMSRKANARTGGKTL